VGWSNGDALSIS